MQKKAVKEKQKKKEGNTHKWKTKSKMIQLLVEM